MKPPDIKTAAEFFGAMRPATRQRIEEGLRAMFWSWAAATAMGYSKDGERILHVYEQFQRPFNNDLREAGFEVFVAPALGDRKLEDILKDAAEDTK